jgi:hypothetical protein
LPFFRKNFLVVWVSIGNTVFYVKKIVTIKARVCKTGIYLKWLEINNNQMNVLAKAMQRNWSQQEKLITL